MNFFDSRTYSAVTIIFIAMTFGYGAYGQASGANNSLQRYYPGMRPSQNYNGTPAPRYDIHKTFAQKQAEANRLYSNQNRQIVITPNRVFINQPLYRQLPTSPALHSNSPIYYTPQGAFLAYPTRVSVPGASGWTNGNNWHYTRKIGGPNSPYWWAE